MQNDKTTLGDEVDLISLVSIFFDNFNLLISILLGSIFFTLIVYLSSTNIYQSVSLIEIKQEGASSILPPSLSGGFGSVGNQNSLDAEIEIYKSNNTILGAIDKLKNTDIYDPLEMNISSGNVRSNLSLSSDSLSLITIKFLSSDKTLSSVFLNLLNEEFIEDRRNFIKESSAAGRDFVSKEIPRIQSLLKEAEDNLNNFAISTNATDVIFDTNSRNSKLERLKNRINEIDFKEVELKEFYKENHPIYVTLSQQKKLVLSQINEIESFLPQVPSTQRTLENLKREVEIYSSVLRELSSQELSLGMAEASSISNVRIINEASEGAKIKPSLMIFIYSFALTILVYIVMALRHFQGDKVSNFDSLIDYVGKEEIIGELPFIDNINSGEQNLSSEVADELLNKTIYEIIHSQKDIKSIAVISSRKDAGKTEISKRLFNKLFLRHKVCLFDFDFRKKGLTKEFAGDKSYKNFNEFNEDKENFIGENESLFIPSFDVESPPDFFTSEEFVDELNTYRKKFDFIICDTPPWGLFIDAKIISKHIDLIIYVVNNQVTSFKDISLVKKDLGESKNLKFFYNKFSLYFNFLWLKYKYPHYAKNYYYDYGDYSNFQKGLRYKFYSKLLSNNFFSSIIEFFKKLRNISKND